MTLQKLTISDKRYHEESKTKSTNCEKIFASFKTKLMLLIHKNPRKVYNNRKIRE